MNAAVSPVRLGQEAVWLSLAGFALLVFAVPPIAQWPEYHDFADRRAWLGVANFADVASNLPFSLVGLAGLYGLASGRAASFIDARERLPWAVFFAGLVLLGPASAYYHLAPNDWRLMIDRMAMATTFMGWLAVHLAERIAPRLAVRALPWLLALALASVLYWYASELAGRGDLRPWGYVQFAPVLLVGWLAWRRRSPYTGSAAIALVYACHALALLAEWRDDAIYAATGLVSGHTLKHLIAAAGAAWALRWLMTRRPVSLDPPPRLEGKGVR